MFLIFVMMLSWLVLAVFAMTIAGLFVDFPSAVLPVNIEILQLAVQANHGYHQILLRLDVL